MPFCDVSKYQTGEDAIRNNGIRIFYTTFGRGPIKVLMIIGLAGTHESWGPQIKGLTGSERRNDEDWPAVDRILDDEGGDVGVEICAFDNRGMGRSSVPTTKSDYTTRIMASDAIAVLDHLGWRKSHVFGHSMGAMIACKFAAMVPDRVQSLALLNVTGGGYQCFPKFDRRTLSVAIRFLKAKTPEQRAAVDLDTHYTKVDSEIFFILFDSNSLVSVLRDQCTESHSGIFASSFVQEYLEELIETKTRREILYQEYVKGISASGMQSSYGFDGQVNACWTHKLSRTELERIRSSGFLVSVIHGRHDIIAQLCHARRLAQKLWPLARMVELHGGHLVSHERTEEVNLALLELIKASESKISPYDWTNLSEKKPSGISTWIVSTRTTQESGNNSSFVKESIHKLNVFILYIFSIFVLGLAYIRRVIRCLKPVRVGTALT